MRSSPASTEELSRETQPHPRRAPRSRRPTVPQVERRPRGAGRQPRRRPPPARSLARAAVLPGFSALSGIPAPGVVSHGPAAGRAAGPASGRARGPPAHHAAPTRAGTALTALSSRGTCFLSLPFSRGFLLASEHICISLMPARWSPHPRVYLQPPRATFALGPSLHRHPGVSVLMPHGLLGLGGPWRPGSQVLCTPHTCPTKHPENQQPRKFPGLWGSGGGSRVALSSWTWQPGGTLQKGPGVDGHRADGPCSPSLWGTVHCSSLGEGPPAGTLDQAHLHASSWPLCRPPVQTLSARPAGVRPAGSVQEAAGSQCVVSKSPQPQSKPGGGQPCEVVTWWPRCFAGSR